MQVQASALVATRSSLERMIEDRIRLSTSNRVRELAVELVEGRIRVRGRVPTWHTKQLALHAALEFVSGEELSEQLELG